MIKLNVKAIIALSAVSIGVYSAINASSDSKRIFKRCVIRDIRVRGASGRQYFVEPGIEAKGVWVGGGDFIQMVPNKEGQVKKSIFSFGFAGCTGTVLYVLLKNGEQRAALTHYPPTRSAEHLSKIHRLATELKRDIDCDEIVKTVGIIFHQGKCAQNPKAGFHIDIIPRDAELVGRLKEVINAELACSNALIIEEIYCSELCLPGEYHPGGMYGDKVVPKELEIVLSPNPEESYFHSKATCHKKQKLSDL